MQRSGVRSPRGPPAPAPTRARAPRVLVIHWIYGAGMIKKLTKHGNSLALVIDRPILDLLKIDPETPLDVSTDGKRLIVAPANPSTRAGSLTQLRSWPTSDMRRPFRSWPNKPPAQISWNRYSCVWTRCWRSTSNRSNDMASSGPRDSAALESAVATPQATFGGEFLHQSIPAMQNQQKDGVPCSIFDPERVDCFVGLGRRGHL